MSIPMMLTLGLGSAGGGYDGSPGDIIRLGLGIGPLVAAVSMITSFISDKCGNFVKDLV